MRLPYERVPSKAEKGMTKVKAERIEALSLNQVPCLPTYYLVRCLATYTKLFASQAVSRYIFSISLHSYHSKLNVKINAIFSSLVPYYVPDIFDVFDYQF